MQAEPPSPLLHLKAEWQAAEAIKIELLSPAARALLIGGGVGWGGFGSLAQSDKRTCPSSVRRLH